MNEITKSLSFEEKLKERVKDSIGDLMTDEDLQKIVARCVEDIFFKKGDVKDSYGRVVRHDLNAVQQIVEEVLKDRVKEEVRQYLKDNQETISGIVKDMVSDGVFAAFVSGFKNMFQQDFYTLQNNLESRLRSI